MISSLTEVRERELALVLFHEGLETLERDNFAQRDVDRLGARFYTKDLGGLVGELGIEADRSEIDRHNIYSLVDLYIHVKRPKSHPGHFRGIPPLRT